MQSLKAHMKRLTPGFIWRPASKAYWFWYNRGRHQLAALFDWRRRESKRLLASYQDFHKGERCFILGNGPSLSHMDLRPLRDEITIGLNRIYILFPELGFSTTYLVSVNDLVIEQCAQDFQKLDIPKFIAWRGRHWMKEDPGVIFLDSDYTLPETFSEEISGRVFEGHTVTYIALQLAYHMGFEQVVLIGVDHNFTTKGDANKMIVSQGPDPNHFHPDYFGKGFRWQLPDLEGSERAYIMAKEAFERDGREVLDATVGGKLTIFPKVEYSSLFEHVIPTIRA